MKRRKKHRVFHPLVVRDHLFDFIFCIPGVPRHLDIADFEHIKKQGTCKADAKHHPGQNPYFSVFLLFSVFFCLIFLFLR